MKALYIVRKMVLFYNLWLVTLAIIITCLLGWSWWLLTMIPLYWAMLHYAHFTRSIYGYPGRLVTWTAVEFNVVRHMKKLNGTYQDILTYWVKYEGRRHYLVGGIRSFVDNFTEFSEDYARLLMELGQLQDSGAGLNGRTTPDKGHED